MVEDGAQCVGQGLAYSHIPKFILGGKMEQVTPVYKIGLLLYAQRLCSNLQMSAWKSSIPMDGGKHFLHVM